MTEPLIEFHPKLDIFQSNADILVNAVNRVGVMGGGIAKAFKDYYPQMYQDYRYFCEQKMNVHEDWYLHVWQGDEHGPLIANLATKDHWKEDSDLRLIEQGLDELMAIASLLVQVKDRSISTAIPKLGCGLGNLQWIQVRPAVVRAIKSGVLIRPALTSSKWLILGEEE